MFKGIDSIIIVTFIIVLLAWIVVLAKMIFGRKQIKEPTKQIIISDKLQEESKSIVSQKSLFNIIMESSEFKFFSGVILGMAIMVLPYTFTAFVLGVIIGYYILKFIKND